MRIQANQRHFWLHKDPQAPENYNIICKSRTEPILNVEENSAMVSHEGKLDDDRFVFVNSPALFMLPEELIRRVDYGKKVEVLLTAEYNVKDLSDPITEPIERKWDFTPALGSDIIPCHDRMIFGTIGSCRIYERQAVVRTPLPDNNGIIREEFVNENCCLVPNPDCIQSDEYYVILGKAGECISPYKLGILWSCDHITTKSMKDVLVDAYQHGLGFIKPPEDDMIAFNVRIMDDNLVAINCESDFYYFGKNMVFSIQKDYRPDIALDTMSIDKNIISVILAYRWFFNKPNLKAVFALDHDVTKETESSWTTREGYEHYMKLVQNYKKKGLQHLSRIVNLRLSARWKLKNENSRCFDPAKLNAPIALIPYAELQNNK